MNARNASVHQLLHLPGGELDADFELPGRVALVGLQGAGETCGQLRAAERRDPPNLGEVCGYLLEHGFPQDRAKRVRCVRLDYPVTCLMVYSGT